MGIENRFLLRTGSQWADSLESLAKVLFDSAIDSSAVCACAMTSHAHSLVFFRPPPTCRLGRGVQKCGYISCEKMTTGPLAMLAKTSFSSKGGYTTYMQKYLFTHQH